MLCPYYGQFKLLSVPCACLMHSTTAHPLVTKTSQRLRFALCDCRPVCLHVLPFCVCIQCEYEQETLRRGYLPNGDVPT